jgi:hypothetical protein
MQLTTLIYMRLLFYWHGCPAPSSSLLRRGVRSRRHGPQQRLLRAREAVVLRARDRAQVAQATGSMVRQLGRVAGRTATIAANAREAVAAHHSSLCTVALLADPRVGRHELLHLLRDVLLAGLHRCWNDWLCYLAHRRHIAQQLLALRWCTRSTHGEREKEWEEYEWDSTKLQRTKRRELSGLRLRAAVASSACRRQPAHARPS